MMNSNDAQQPCCCSGSTFSKTHHRRHGLNEHFNEQDVQCLEQLLVQGHYRSALITANRELRRCYHVREKEDQQQEQQGETSTDLQHQDPQDPQTNSITPDYSPSLESPTRILRPLESLLAMKNNDKRNTETVITRQTSERTTTTIRTMITPLPFHNVFPIRREQDETQKDTTTTTDHPVRLRIRYHNHNSKKKDNDHHHFILERIGAVALQCCFELWKHNNKEALSQKQQQQTLHDCWKHLQPFWNVFAGSPPKDSQKAIIDNICNSSHSMSPELALLVLQLTWAIANSCRSSNNNDKNNNTRSHFFHATMECTCELLHSLESIGTRHPTGTFTTTTTPTRTMSNDCATWLLTELLPRVQSSDSQNQQQQVQDYLDRAFAQSAQDWKPSDWLWEEMPPEEEDTENSLNPEMMTLVLEYLQKQHNPQNDGSLRSESARDPIDPVTLDHIQKYLQHQLDQESAARRKEKEPQHHGVVVSRRGVASPRHGGDPWHRAIMSPEHRPPIMPISSLLLTWRHIRTYFNKVRVRIQELLLSPNVTAYERSVVAVSVVSFLMAWRKRATLWRVSRLALRLALQPLQEILDAILPGAARESQQ